MTADDPSNSNPELQNQEPLADTRPLRHLDDWEDDLKLRYPKPKSEKFFSQSGDPAPHNSLTQTTGEKACGVDQSKPRDSFRDYAAEARSSVKEFYRLNHTFQTYDFVVSKRTEYLKLDHRKMGIWEAMEFLNTLVDDSDPDTDLSQIEHLLQTAESIRKDGHPDWFVLTGLIHDLGKILCLMGEPQWAVVGDTFPVGCRYAEGIVYHEFFKENPDWNHPIYSKPLGIYDEKIGLDRIIMSWGHDEYLYHVVRDYLPLESLYMIRYHSFYAAHRENEYRYFFNEQDHQLFDWVCRFNEYDLYSKSDERPDVKQLQPYYQSLIEQYFPASIAW